MTVHNVLIALGANLATGADRPAETLGKAVEAIRDTGVTNLRSSRFFRTPAHPPGAGPDFVNACVSGGWEGTPDALLAALHGIEATFGRTRTRRWGERALDLDLLACDDMVLPDAQELRRWIDLPPERQAAEAPEQLILPHPRMQDRAFVLVPLAEIAAEWRHPLLGRSVAEMLELVDPEQRKAARPL